MADTYDLIIRGGSLVSHRGIELADVAVLDGRIAAIGKLAGASAATDLTATGLHVLPGVIDTQVHFREPGMEHKEDWETGTKAAVLGGVTAVFEMPNTRPATVDEETFTAKLRNVRGRVWCDYAFYLGATPDNIEGLASLEQMPACCGVKMFMGSSTGDLLVADDDTVKNVLGAGHRRIAVHSEDEGRLQERRPIAEDGGDVHRHPEWRDEMTAFFATRRLLGLARLMGRRVHVLHVSTAEEIELLAGNKDIASVEVTPQHLTLAAPECYDRLGTLAQMNPPIRTAGHRDRLWRAVREGIVDVIGSDHAPHTLEEKSQPYPQSPSGMPGVQTLLPLMLDHVNAGRLTLSTLVDLVCSAPAALFGIARKGRIAVGHDGDFTIVDLASKHTISNGEMASKCGWTPYDGMEVTGWPIATVVRGGLVMMEGELIGEPRGARMHFGEALSL